MEDSENIEKPLVYRLTDRWVPIILFLEFLVFILFGFMLDDYKENLSNQVVILLIATASYFGIKWIHYGHARKNPSMRSHILRMFIGFFWIFGIFLGFISPFIYLFSVNLDLVPTMFFPSIAGLSFALGASHSWGYSFQIKAEEEAENSK